MSSKRPRTDLEHARPRLTAALAAQARSAKAAHQVPPGDGHRAVADGVDPQARRDVVVITLERQAAQTQALGELVQFVETLVADEMRPSITAKRPGRLVHQDGHDRRIREHRAIVGWWPCLPTSHR